MTDETVIRTSKANHGLLPCPFCGTDAELNTASNSPDWMIISCPNITCAVNPGIEGLYDELADVVAAWNKRPTIEELRREVANWRSASETNLATCKRLREQLKAHGNETGDARDAEARWLLSHAITRESRIEWTNRRDAWLGRPLSYSEHATTQKASEQPSPVDDAEFGTAEWRAANPESDGVPRG
jgi:hypothetical protein